MCSPKLPPSRLKLEVFHEIKLVVPTYDPAEYEAWIRDRHALCIETRAALSGTMRHRWRPVYKWVQPEDGPEVEAATEECIKWCLEHPEWRLSYQMHKAIGVE